MTTSSSKKRGRSAKTFKQADAHNALLTSLIEELIEKIKSLEHQAVQYQAVISYLENKLENK